MFRADFTMPKILVGKFYEENEVPADLQDQIGISRLLDLSANRCIDPSMDGYSESFWRIMDHYDEYHMIDLGSMINLHDKHYTPFVAFVRLDEHAPFLDAMCNYVRNLMYPKFQDDNVYELNPELRLMKHHITDNIPQCEDTPDDEYCWYCISPSTRYTIGDWIMFINADHRVETFIQHIEESYNEWWMRLPDIERAELVGRSTPMDMSNYE